MTSKIKFSEKSRCSVYAANRRLVKKGFKDQFDAMEYAMNLMLNHPVKYHTLNIRSEFELKIG